VALREVRSLRAKSVTRSEATVVIPCLNSGALLADCLRAVGEQTIRDRLRVVVVDNGSVDDSIRVAGDSADGVLVTSVRGPAGPRNRGLHDTSTPLLLSLDADCVPECDWAERHIDSLRAAAPDVLATAGRLQPLPSADRWASRADITPHPAFDAGECQYAVGGNACYRTGLLRQLGGFPQYSADDAALGIAARRAGLRFQYVSAAIVFHRNPSGWTGYARQCRKIGRYAAELETTSPTPARLVHTRGRMLGGALRLLARGEPEEALAATTRALAGAVGAVDVWRARSSR
jgi:GT2 family glycosyltransferase